MAFVTHYTNKAGEEKVLYNVTMAVGPNAANRRDDVMLVQYMLKRIYERPKYSNFTLSPQQGTMIVDGLFGPTTARWIRHFQTDVRIAGGNILVDGRIDSDTESGISTISETEYTIAFINYAFRSHYPEIHAKMPTHPDVPAEVKAALLLSMAIV
jgi:hypothetical protein